jgi:hypothetical protein
MKKKDMMMREKKKSGLWNKRHARKPRSNKRASWWRSRKAGPGEKKENLAAAWHKILKILHTLAYFFSTNLLQQFPRNNNILNASEECVTRLDDDNQAPQPKVANSLTKKEEGFWLQSFYSLGEAVTVGGLTPSCAHMNVVLLRRWWWFGGFTGALLLLHRQRTRLS